MEEMASTPPEKTRVKTPSEISCRYTDQYGPLKLIRPGEYDGRAVRK
jgi:hypothetical protein